MNFIFSAWVLLGPDPTHIRTVLGPRSSDATQFLSRFICSSPSFIATDRRRQRRRLLPDPVSLGAPTASSLPRGSITVPLFSSASLPRGLIQGWRSGDNFLCLSLSRFSPFLIPPPSVLWQSWREGRSRLPGRLFVRSVYRIQRPRTHHTPVPISSAAATAGIHCDLHGEDDGLDMVAASCPAPPTATFTGSLASSPIHDFLVLQVPGQLEHAVRQFCNELKLAGSVSSKLRKHNNMCI